MDFLSHLLSFPVSDTRSLKKLSMSSLFVNKIKNVGSLHMSIKNKARASIPTNIVIRVVSPIVNLTETIFSSVLKYCSKSFSILSLSFNSLVCFLYLLREIGTKYTTKTKGNAQHIDTQQIQAMQS